MKVLEFIFKLWPIFTIILSFIQYRIVKKAKSKKEKWLLPIIVIVVLMIDIIAMTLMSFSADQTNILGYYGIIINVMYMCASSFLVFQFLLIFNASKASINRH